MTVIGSYTLTTEFKNEGGGQCRWAFAEKDGREYFIKEFLAPRYPKHGSPKNKKKIEEECEKFKKRHEDIKKLLNEFAKPGGSLVTTKDFFRDGYNFYKITDKIDVVAIPIQNIHTIDFKKQIILSLAAVHAVNAIHNAGMVHGDLKPANILIAKTDEAFTAKVIDFDDSFIAGNPPPVDRLIGDLRYYSPEMHKYVQGEPNGSDITASSDIFALGIVLTEYFTGRRPYFPDKKYMNHTVADAVLGGQTPEITLNPDQQLLKDLILDMLKLNYKDRPSAFAIGRRLKDIKRNKKIPPPPSPALLPSVSTPTVTSKVTGTLVSKMKKDVVSSPSILKGTLINKPKPKLDPGG